jgi:hypothetical protein
MILVRQLFNHMILAPGTRYLYHLRVFPLFELQKHLTQILCLYCIFLVLEVELLPLILCHFYWFYLLLRSEFYLWLKIPKDHMFLVRVYYYPILDLLSLLFYMMGRFQVY